jgi:hypothetical protein
MSQKPIPNIEQLYGRVTDIIEAARDKVYISANFAMGTSYWNIGREIVEEEQHGKSKAEYGAYIIKSLAARLKKEYGKGYVEQNLRNMRQFYSVFPKRNALRSELTWTHYRILMRIENEAARTFYLEEEIQREKEQIELEKRLSK